MLFEYKPENWKKKHTHTYWHAWCWRWLHIAPVKWWQYEFKSVFDRMDVKKIGRASMVYFWEAKYTILFLPYLCYQTACIIPLFLTVPVSTGCITAVHTHTDTHTHAHTLYTHWACVIPSIFDESKPALSLLRGNVWQDGAGWPWRYCKERGRTRRRGKSLPIVCEFDIRPAASSMWVVCLMW